MATSEPVDAFDRAWAVAAEVPGWLTVAQARALWTAAHRLKPGDLIVEIGSHQGRSTVILGTAAAAVGARVVAVDPFVAQHGGAEIRARFEATIVRAGLESVVDLECEYSTRLRRRWSGSIALLYVDGKHDYWTATDDLRWAEFMPSDTEIYVHDAFSSFGVTTCLLLRVLPSRRLAYRERVGSLAILRNRKPTGADRWLMLRELRWFTRNLFIKAVLRLRLRPVARAMGHHELCDPY